MTTKTQKQIVNRINNIKDDDFFGWQTGDLIAYLDFEHAKQFLKDDVTAEQWADMMEKRTPKEKIEGYMKFAWDKANNCRGISAGRSLEHMKAWVWLDGEDDLLNIIEADYDHYGKPHLVAICEHYGYDWKMYDNNEWVNSEYETPKTAEQVLAQRGATHDTH